jgi:PAS domain S-box-containing protein
MPLARGQKHYVANMTDPRHLHSWQAQLTLAGLFLLLYVGFDWLSYWHPIASIAITPWNPPPGLSISLLLLFGMRFSWLLFPAALLAEWWVRDVPASWPILLISSGILACGYAGTAWLLRKALGGNRLQTLNHVTRFLVIVALASLVIGSAFVAVFHFAATIPAEQVAAAILHFWTGDVIGILVVAPLLLVHAGSRSSHPWQAQDVVWVLLLSTLLWFIFALESTDEFRLFYLLFIPLIALSLRRGLHGATLAAALAQAAVIFFLHPRDVSSEVVRDLQLLLIAFVITGLYVGAVVNERTSALLALGDSERRMRKLIETAPDAIITVSNEGFLEETNLVGEALLGEPVEQLRHRSITSILPELNTLNESGFLRTCLVRKDGGRSTVELAYANHGTGSICIVRDVSDRMKMATELEHSQLALARANRMAAVSELAGALAHELNQPLSAISLYVRSCQHVLTTNGSSLADIAPIMEKIDHEVQRAGEVVHRLREFFRSDSLTLTTNAINKLVSQVAANYQQQAGQRGVTLKLQLDSEDPALQVDVLGLQTAIDNLLRNAFEVLVKSSKPEIIIRIEHDASTLRISVMDNGGGVPEEFQAHLFDAMATNKPEGIGLGLKISRKLVEAHGGRLQYRSLPGGACFLIELPLGASGVSK